MLYENISSTEMTPACGSIITGLNLSDTLETGQIQAINNLLIARTVLVFRDQSLTEEDQVRFAKYFGDLQPSEISGFQKHEHHPEIDILEYDSDNPPHVTRDLWHTDFAGREEPSMGTILLAKDIPPDGGDTIWVSTVAAYDALSDRMQNYLTGLQAYHDNYQPYDEHVRPELWAKDYFDDNRRMRDGYRPALHPIIRTHPVSGKKGLFVNESMTTLIRGLSRRESDYVLQYLFDHLRTPEFQYRHKWKVNDLAIWDNRLSLHYALFDYSKHRLMHRIVIKGDKPF
ncbi:MAG: TauD/TfdA family dioxygenase [Pseudomonadota bacterium]|nr:TauD/TfdA family dioxygenase [Pseudomonadota bacterium]